MLATKIKEQTAASHRLLESHPLFHSLNGNFNDNDYLRLLSKMHAYYQTLENAYSPYFSGIDALELGKRQRAYVLAEDLKNKYGHVPSSMVQVTSFVPVIDTIWKATGALYVIEGSSLGSRLISQSLAKSGIQASNGGAYFFGYGEDTGKMWKSFVSFMNEVAVTNEQEQEVIVTAEKVFSTLYNWLDKND